METIYLSGFPNSNKFVKGQFLYIIYNVLVPLHYKEQLLGFIRHQTTYFLIQNRLQVFDKAALLYDYSNCGGFIIDLLSDEVSVVLHLCFHHKDRLSSCHGLEVDTFKGQIHGP
jgi:hypothetical protein